MLENLVNSLTIINEWSTLSSEKFFWLCFERLFDRKCKQQHRICYPNYTNKIRPLEFHQICESQQRAAKTELDPVEYNRPNSL